MVQYFFLFVSLVQCSSPLLAAAPVVHAYCAQLYFKTKQYTPREQELFMIGTLFPDIRYLAHIPRTRTHRKQVTLQEIRATKDPFEAGLLFHSYVDEQRERIAQREKVYDVLAFVPKGSKGHFLKAVEDELCYDRLDVPSVLRAMNSYARNERNYKISSLYIHLWHFIIRNYLKQSPGKLFKECARKKRSYATMKPAVVGRLSVLIENYAQDERIKKYVQTFLDEFEKLLQQ